MIRYAAIIVMLTGAAGACTSQPAVEVRQVNMPGRAPVGSDIAYARASLALGNNGLALQQFRQALRANPGSTDALSGIASCYDNMGRIDLSRRYYEEALALAPADIAILRSYATSLARNGAVADALAVNTEIALRTKAPAQQWVVERVTTTEATPVDTPVTAPPAAASTEQTARLETVRSPTVSSNVRLERVSLGEIALITSGAPVWKALPTPTPARSIVVLNAARLQGLAARHRALLRGAGVQSVAIGDAPHVRKSSLILYPIGRVREARRLAGSLRIAAVRAEARADILILLGRDRA